MEAIRMIMGVVDVSPITTTMDDHINRMQIKNEFIYKLCNFIQNKIKI